MAIMISGHSDDIVSIDGDAQDEIGNGRSITIGSRETGGVVVAMKYGVSGAVWQARVRQIDEGVLCPWPVSITNEDASGFPNPQSYSVRVTVDCPKGTPVMVGKRNLAAPR